MDSQDLLEKMAFTLSKLLILHFVFFTNLRAKSTKMSKKKRRKVIIFCATVQFWSGEEFTIKFFFFEKNRICLTE